MEQEKVIVRGAQQTLPLFAGSPADRFNALDAKRLEDGFSSHIKAPAKRRVHFSSAILRPGEPVAQPGCAFRC
jgi:hypothetical protein